MDETTAYIALGSNLGARRALIREALARLDAVAGVRVVRVSSPWETEPVGVVDQPRFVNAAAELATSLAPEALLACALAVERALGRDRSGAGVRWGPRRIDIDLLLYGAQRMATSSLELPHPRMLERAFVLAPLAEIAPQRVHPVVGHTIAELAARLDGAAVRRLDEWEQEP